MLVVHILLDYLKLKHSKLEMLEAMGKPNSSIQNLTYPIYSGCDEYLQVSVLYYIQVWNSTFKMILP